MNKQEKIKEVKHLINIGNIVKINNGTLWLSDDNKYIMFRNYGQSAVRNNIKDLTWLINIIFETKNKDFNYNIVKSIFA